MQDITKYRAKRKDTGAWVYGSLIWLPDNRNELNAIIVDEKANSFRKPNAPGGDWLVIPWGWYSVDADTVEVIDET